MKIWQTELPLLKSGYPIEKYFTPSSIFFDIETTGFSASHSQVYMIGYATNADNTISYATNTNNTIRYATNTDNIIHYATNTDSTIRITQLFAETPAEEPEILAAFAKTLPQYRTLVSFNGTGFDVPFLEGRYAHYGIPETLDSFQHLDIYKQVSKYKNILQLPSLKQKDLEKFLGIRRDGQYSGGDLIPVYLEYAKRPSKEARSLLKLHNSEDMAGMVKLLPLLSYSNFFEGNFQISSLETRKWETYEKKEGWELILSLETEEPFPQRFSCQQEGFYVTGLGQQAKLRVQFYVGELKYFYPNYKEYYYLPAEDRAVHKSVASYVGRDYRIQASASNCYSKKTGCFLPQYQELFAPSLKQEYRDKVSYFEFTESFKTSEEQLKKYAMHLLGHLS